MNVDKEEIVKQEKEQQNTKNTSVIDDLQESMDAIYQRIKIEKIKDDVCFDSTETLQRLPQALAHSWKKAKKSMQKSGILESVQTVFYNGLVALDIFLESLGKELTKK